MKNISQVQAKVYHTKEKKAREKLCRKGIRQDFTLPGKKE